MKGYGARMRRGKALLKKLGQRGPGLAVQKELYQGRARRFRALGPVAEEREPEAGAPAPPPVMPRRAEA